VTVRFNFGTIVVALALAVVGSAWWAAGVAAQQPVTIQLSSQNNSGITGTAVLTPMGAQTRVVLTIQGGPPDGNHPAHIHAGTCANLDPRPLFPLPNVQNGRSEATVNVSIDQIRAARHAINVHKSPQEASVYVACGDLPFGAATAMPRTGAGGGDGVGAALAGAGGLLALLTAGVLALAMRRRAA
jgi:hypothetical protein